jgi:hypothetical protein
MGKRPLTKKIQKMLDECDVDKNGTIGMFRRWRERGAIEGQESGEKSGDGVLTKFQSLRNLLLSCERRQLKKPSL